MKTPIAAAAVALAAISFAPDAWAQGLGAKLLKKPAPPASSAPADPSTKRASATRTTQDPMTAPPVPNSAPRALIPEPLRSTDEVPGPTTEPKEPEGPRIPLPTEPLEPFMLTKENGPFMVLAYSFRGPDAPREALALVLELRNKYRLPAYILLPRKFPNRSNIRGVPPQAPAFATRDDVGVPEIYRTLDEAAVLVGNEKTVKDSNVLMRKVKAIHPECIDGVQQIWQWRKGKGLTRAIMTTNPFVPAEALFPQQQDILVGELNEGDHNIRKCPGRYSLEIANFTGRQSFDENDQRFKGKSMFTKSPLESAGTDAERLAESLAKDKEIIQTGYEPYVFHDRFSSRVFMGTFNSPTDAEARKLHDRLVELMLDLKRRKVTPNTIIVPSPTLTDLGPIKKQLQPPAPLQQVRAN